MAASASNSTLSAVGLQQGQFGVSHQEPLVTVSAEAHCQMRAQDNSSTTPLSVKQDKSCIPTSSTISQVHIQSRDKAHVQDGTEASLTQDLVIRPESTAQFSLATLPSPQEKVDKRGSDVLADDVPRTLKSDGYNWRKYGQKQVKSVGSLRSYYRCTNTSCSARKKVQHVDLSGEIIDVIYKGEHNHDPPPKGFSRKRFSSESSAQKLDGPCRPSSTSRESEPVVQLNFECHDSNLNTAVGTSLRDVEEQHQKMPDAVRLESEPPKVPAEVEHGSSSNANEHSKIDIMNERDIPIKKRRIKEESKACTEHVYRTFKEPKIVVHGAADAGTSTDGYRWRKYGQKMVKGNPHPRSYYRCSTAGCPVRKHVEKANDGSSAIMAMYEGEHNHEMPAPKTQPSALKSLVPVTPTDAVNNVPLLMLEDKPQLPDPVNYAPVLMLEDKPQSPAPVSPPQQSRDSHTDIGEEKATSDVGADKVTESQSARTLLTIGIELESC